VDTDGFTLSLLPLKNDDKYLETSLIRFLTRMTYDSNPSKDFVFSLSENFTQLL
jgi:hypothetical protein